MSNSLHASLMASYACVDDALDGAGLGIHAAFHGPKAAPAQVQRRDGVATLRLYDLGAPAAPASLLSRLAGFAFKATQTPIFDHPNSMLAHHA